MIKEIEVILNNQLGVNDNGEIFIYQKKPYVVMTQKGDLEFDTIESARLCEKTHNGFLLTRKEINNQNFRKELKRRWC